LIGDDVVFAIVVVVDGAAVLGVLITNGDLVPKDSSLDSVVKTELKNLVIEGFKYVTDKENQSSSQEQELYLKKVAFHLGLYSLIILIGIILIVNGIISLVAGTIIFLHDRRKIHYQTKT
jgi:hypothetical protein